MHVRDAGEGDAALVAEQTDLSTAAARKLCRDRTVRVAERDGDAVGVVAFDARPGVVHVTHLAGERAAMERLLAEPRAFAESEGMAVELVAPESDPALAAARDTGFADVGAGPRFEGKQTRRLRWEPADG